MSELFFVIKTLFVTAIVIVLLQIRVGPHTLENRALGWLRTSTAVEALRGVADGAVGLGIELYGWSKKAIEKEIGMAKSSERRSTERRPRKQRPWEEEVAEAEGDHVD